MKFQSTIARTGNDAIFFRLFLTLFVDGGEMWVLDSKWQQQNSKKIASIYKSFFSSLWKCSIFIDDKFPLHFHAMRHRPMTAKFHLSSAMSFTFFVHSLLDQELFFKSGKFSRSFCVVFSSSTHFSWLISRSFQYNYFYSSIQLRYVRVNVAIIDGKWKITFSTRVQTFSHSPQENFHVRLNFSYSQQTLMPTMSDESNSKSVECVNNSQRLNCVWCGVVFSSNFFLCSWGKLNFHFSHFSSWEKSRDEQGKLRISLFTHLNKDKKNISSTFSKFVTVNWLNL